MKFSSTVQNALVGVGDRPAPDTPLAASTISPVGSIEPGVEQRRERERRRSDVATGGGDEAGALELGPVSLGQAVDRLGEQLGLVVLEPVPLRVQRGVLEAERRRQVDDAADPADELRRQGHRGLVREAEEHDVETVDGVECRTRRHGRSG